MLPTGGTARFASGLSANDFLQRSSVLSFTRDGLRRVAGDVRVLADKEGLTAHAASVEIRLGEQLGPQHTAVRQDAYRFLTPDP